MNWDSILTKTSRITAWIAILLVILFIITGYGMTKRIIDPDLAKYVHQKILPLPLFITLILHGGICARQSLRRWRVFRKQATSDLYVILLSGLLLLFFLWLYFLK